MVRIFNIFNGTQDVDLIKGQMFRVQGKFKKNKTSSLPGDLTYYKGSFAASLSRDFVSLLWTDPLAQEYYKWLEGTQFPDEGLWSTIAHNQILDVPGGYPGSCLNQKNATEKKAISRFQIWPGSKNRKCCGRWVRGSCSFGIKDLPRIINAEELIGHKVSYQHDSLVHICMKEWVQNRTYGLSEQMKDYSFYSNLPAVRFHNMHDKSKFEYHLHEYHSQIPLKILLKGVNVPIQPQITEVLKEVAKRNHFFLYTGNFTIIFVIITTILMYYM